jgi:hypothetical protein
MLPPAPPSRRSAITWCAGRAEQPLTSLLRVLSPILATRLPLSGMFPPLLRCRLLSHLVRVVTCSNVCWDPVDNGSSTMIEFCNAHHCSLCEQRSVWVAMRSRDASRNPAVRDAHTGYAHPAVPDLGLGAGVRRASDAGAGRALTSRRRNGTSGSERVAAQRFQVTRRSPVKGLVSARVTAVRSPLQHDPHKEIDDI